jgi:drug/metabolite transporter (DMT)-like permease
VTTLIAGDDDGDQAAAGSQQRPDTVALAAGLVTVILWGSAFVAIRAADQRLSPGALALGRLLVSTAILGIAVRVRREPRPRPGDLLPIATYGILWLGVYSVALNAAERRVDAGTAAMIISTGPILIALLAGIFLREGFPSGLFTGCAVALGGCILIGISVTETGARSTAGIALLAVAVLAYSSAVILQKPVLTRVTPLQVTWVGCAAATIACLPFAPQLVSEARAAGAAALGWTVYLGAFPTALGFATWTVALRRTSAGRLGSLLYLSPVVAIALGWAVLGQTPPWLAMTGGGMSLVGVYFAQRNRRGAEVLAARLQLAAARRKQHRAQSR